MAKPLIPSASSSIEWNILKIANERNKMKIRRQYSRESGQDTSRRRLTRKLRGCKSIYYPSAAGRPAELRWWEAGDGGEGTSIELNDERSPDEITAQWRRAREYSWWWGNGSFDGGFRRLIIAVSLVFVGKWQRFVRWLALWGRAAARAVDEHDDCGDIKAALLWR